MANNKLTDLAFRKLKAQDKEQIIPDGGGLYIRVRSISDGGAVSFRFRYLLQGKQIWLTLKAKTLAEARKERDDYKAIAKQGIDPATEQKLSAERARAAQLAEQAELARQQALTSVSGLFERWVMTDLQQRKDLAEVQRMFAKDVLPIIGGINAQDIRKSHVTDVIDRVKQRGSVHTSRNLLKLMRQMFKFAVDRDVIEFDPTASLSVSKVTTKNTERDRVLSQDEIRLLKDQLPAAGLMPTTECAIWIMLSTLCRVGELSKAEWKHVDFDTKTFFIPVENSKNDKAHTVYLSDFALNQFQRLFAFRQSDTWLFPNTRDSSHVCEKSITKQIDGRQNSTVYSNRSKANQALVLPGGKWTPHDLRRTGATMMGNLGVHGDVIEKCLNHTQENKLKRVYQHQELKAEQAEGWRVLGERLELLTGGNPNVIPIKRAS
ncbi:tyrosine-type recombinase/integrase [Methylomonas sp. SURF-1]|uniref:Tyrosine-type recombinase/integrase n=1 Tax=Methylomonas aurea TaxID=2952224 RepID=A0ABT1UPH6_9GAMM|nr:site-specific integrase [Methylomonas sp. SURF-1]MCQ8183738.1 tyrosine-type recombinase/integrase [Methylomonas sp. SURF-1]